MKPRIRRHRTPSGNVFWGVFRTPQSKSPVCLGDSLAVLGRKCPAFWERNSTLPPFNVQGPLKV